MKTYSKLLLMIILTWSTTIHQPPPPDLDTHCLAEAVYRESRGEPLQGQVAVARVVMNRTRLAQYPSTPCGVVFQKNQFSWTVHHSHWGFLSSHWEIAQRVRLEGPTHFKSTHFHNRQVTPSWNLVYTTTIYNHHFYEPQTFSTTNLPKNSGKTKNQR